MSSHPSLSDSSSTLTLWLLGSLEIELDGRTLTSQLLAKAQAVLVYLALTQQPQSRASLMVLLWGDSPEAAAQASLRQVLANLRTHLSYFVEIDRQLVRLRPETSVWVDAVTFEQQLTQALQQQEMSTLEAALHLYRGELLGGFSVRNAPDFERWLYAEQERLRQLAVRGLEVLAVEKKRAGKLEETIAHLRRILVLESWREETHRQLMEVLAHSGQRTAALAQYETLVQLLDEELGVEPSPESQALYKEIQQNRIKVTETSSPQNYAEPRLMIAAATPLVGRQVEWQRLLQAWQQASQERAQMVMIAGEAGIGKTRLAEELAKWVHQQGERVAVAHCYAAEGAMAFTPVIELLRSEPISRSLAELDEVWLARVARLLPELLTQYPHLRVTEPSGDPLERQRFFEAITWAFLGSQKPLLLIIDDLQWVDRETLEWMRYLLRFAPQAKFLLVGTVRSEELTTAHPLQPLLVNLQRAQQLIDIQLDRLNAVETGMLAAHVAQREVPSEEVVSLYQQTEGNPLFVVETVRAELWAIGRVSSHSAPSDSVAQTVPEGISAIIQARLMQLSPLAQEVAQLIAIVGRTFSSKLLAQAGKYPEEELLQSLDELWQRHILQDLGGDNYDFSHARIRDVAYSQVTPIRRRLLHRRIAQAFEQLHTQDIEAISGVVAAHYELADQPLQAIHYYQRAARFANQAYAYQDAIVVLRKALGLLTALRDPHEEHLQEVKIQMMLGHALMMANSWSDVEAQRAYDRALELCHGANTTIEVYEAMWALHEIYLFQADKTKALEASKICWEMAQRLGDPELLMQAHHTFWGLYFWFYIGPEGLQSVVEHARQGLALYQADWHQSHILRFGGHDPGVCAYNVMSYAQVMLGYVEQGTQATHKAIALARQLNHPFTLANAIVSTAIVYSVLDEPELSLTYLDEVRAILLEHDIPMIKAQERTWRGWALGRLTPNETAVSLVQEGIDWWRKTGLLLDQPEWLAKLAEVCLWNGDIQAARTIIEEGIALGTRTGEDKYRTELYRLQGQCWLAMDNISAAETSFRQALVLAQTQKVKLFELRAAMDLSQLWSVQGRQAAAHDLLESVYRWFTEGFTTTILRRAQELLRTFA